MHLNGPILICGCPGSGTSLVTKMLRYAGMSAGSDAGPLESRKYHESRCFQEANNVFLSETIGFPHAPKGHRQFMDHVTRSMAQLDQLARMVDKEELLRKFWGDDQPTNIWGWKDPRNSANAIIWRSIFPEMRVLILCRKWRWSLRRQADGSEAGEWFRHGSDRKIRKLYVHPPGIDGLDTHCVNFDQLLSSSKTLEQLLGWVGLPTAPAQSYASFLNRVGFERCKSG